MLNAAPRDPLHDPLLKDSWRAHKSQRLQAAYFNLSIIGIIFTGILWAVGLSDSGQDDETSWPAVRHLRSTGNAMFTLLHIIMWLTCRQMQRGGHVNWPSRGHRLCRAIL